jgi:hypothetical protein
MLIINNEEDNKAGDEGEGRTQLDVIQKSDFADQSGTETSYSEVFF